MRNFTFYKKATWVFALALVLVIASCSKSDDLASTTDEAVNLKAALIGPVPVVTFSQVNGACGVQNAALIAGQNYTAGNVRVSTNAEGKLFVTVTTQDGWSLKGIHLYVGSQASVPVNKSGSPVPGNFPVNQSFSTYQNVVTFEFNVADFPSCFIVALHAEVSRFENEILVQSETAWGAGTRFVAKGSWATYFNYCVVTCTPPPGNPNECTYDTDSSFGGDQKVDPIKGSWFVYYTFGAGSQTLWAGQDKAAGTVNVSASGVITITLNTGYELNGTDAIQIEGFDVAPTERNTGQTTTKYNSISEPIAFGVYNYYIIHVNVKKCQATN